MALAGAGLACLEGATRLGAGVGGVVIVCVSFALAVALLLAGARARRRAVIVVASPIAGLVALAVIDLLTAHGSGQYYGSLLHAHSAGEVREVIMRRYEAAWRELGHGAMPLATLLALAGGAAALRLRSRVLGPVSGDPAWNAALYGSLTAGVVGALVEDSGPCCSCRPCSRAGACSVTCGAALGPGAARDVGRAAGAGARAQPGGPAFLSSPRPAPLLARACSPRELDPLERDFSAGDEPQQRLVGAARSGAARTVRAAFRRARRRSHRRRRGAADGPRSAPGTGPPRRPGALVFLRAPPAQEQDHDRDHDHDDQRRRRRCSGFCGAWGVFLFFFGRRGDRNESGIPLAVIWA